MRGIHCQTGRPVRPDTNTTRHDSTTLRGHDTTGHDDPPCCAAQCRRRIAGTGTTLQGLRRVVSCHSARRHYSARRGMRRTPTQIQAEEEGRGLVEVWPEQIQAKEEEGRPRNCQLCFRGGRGLEAAPVGGGRRTRRTPALLARTEEDGATPSALDAASAMASARSERGGGGGG